MTVFYHEGPGSILGQSVLDTSRISVTGAVFSHSTSVFTCQYLYTEVYPFSCPSPMLYKLNNRQHQKISPLIKMYVNLYRFKSGGQYNMAGTNIRLRAGEYEYRIWTSLAGTRAFPFLQVFQAISGVHPVSYWVVTWGISSRTRRPESETLPVCCKINNRDRLRALVNAVMNFRCP